MVLAGSLMWFWPMQHLSQVLFGELRWMRHHSKSALWTGPHSFEGKRDWRACKPVDLLDYALRTASRGMSRVVCWYSTARGAHRAKHTDWRLLAFFWMQLGSWKSWVPKLPKMGCWWLFLEAASSSSRAAGTAWVPFQLRPSSAAHIPFPSGLLSQHERLTFLGLLRLMNKYINSYAGWKRGCFPNKPHGL